MEDENETNKLIVRHGRNVELTLEQQRALLEQVAKHTKVLASVVFAQAIFALVAMVLWLTGAAQ